MCFSLFPLLKRDGLALPPYGWNLDVRATDALGQWVDAGSVEVVLSGGDGPDPDALRAAAEVTATGVNICVPEAASLPPGDWSVQVKISDLSGNVGQSNIIDFRVDAPTSGALPFDLPGEQSFDLVSKRRKKNGSSLFGVLPLRV